MLYFFIYFSAQDCTGLQQNAKNMHRNASHENKNALELHQKCACRNKSGVSFCKEKENALEIHHNTSKVCKRTYSNPSGLYFYGVKRPSRMTCKHQWCVISGGSAADIVDI